MQNTGIIGFYRIFHCEGGKKKLPRHRKTDCKRRARFLKFTCTKHSHCSFYVEKNLCWRNERKKSDLNSRPGNLKIPLFVRYNMSFYRKTRNHFQPVNDLLSDLIHN